MLRCRRGRVELADSDDTGHLPLCIVVFRLSVTLQVLYDFKNPRLSQQYIHEPNLLLPSSRDTRRKQLLDLVEWFHERHKASEPRHK